MANGNIKIEAAPEHFDDVLNALVPSIGGRFTPGAVPAHQIGFSPIQIPAGAQAGGALPSALPALPLAPLPVLRTMRSVLPPMPASGDGDGSRLSPSPLTKAGTSMLGEIPSDKPPRMSSSEEAAASQPALPEIPLQVDEPQQTNLRSPSRFRHAMSILGKVGKDVGYGAVLFADPSLAPLIPGTPANRWMQARQQQWLQDEQARRGYEQSETARNLAEANRKPETRLQSLEVAGPDGKPMLANFNPATGGYSDTSGKPLTNVAPYEAPTGGKTRLERVTLAGPDGKPMAASYDPASGKYMDTAGQPLTSVTPYEKPSPELHDAFSEWKQDPQDYEKFATAMNRIKSQGGKNTGFMTMYAMYRLLQTAYHENPALLPVVNEMFKNVMAQQGMPVPKNFDISQVPVDQPLSPATEQPIGTRMPGAPTQSTRAQAQVAARVLEEMPTVRNEVTDAAKNLGPAKGRLLIGFLLGSVGSTGDADTDRKLNKLRTDLTFASSASARFHLNSVRAMEQFDKLVSAGKSSPDAIQGFLDSVEEWAKTAKAQELGFGERGAAPATGPQVGTIEGGYRFKGGNPADKSNWEKVK